MAQKQEAAAAAAAPAGSNQPPKATANGPDAGAPSCKLDVSLCIRLPGGLAGSVGASSDAAAEIHAVGPRASAFEPFKYPLVEAYGRCACLLQVLHRRTVTFSSAALRRLRARWLKARR